MQLTTVTKNFKERNVSVRKAMFLLAKNRIQVNESEAATILEFLYLIAKSHKVVETIKERGTPDGKSNTEKVVR